MRYFDQICQAALNQDRGSLDAILKEGASIDESKPREEIIPSFHSIALSDSTSITITPAAKLASKGENLAWKLLQEYGASTYYISQGLGYGGKFGDFNHLQKEYHDDLRITLFFVLGLIQSGYFEHKEIALNSLVLIDDKLIRERIANIAWQELYQGKVAAIQFLTLTTDKSNQERIANDLLNQRSSQYDMQAALKSAHKICYLMKHADLKDNQALAWEKADLKTRSLLLHSSDLSDDKTNAPFTTKVLEMRNGPTDIIFSYLTGLTPSEVASLKSKIKEFREHQQKTITEEKIPNDETDTLQQRPRKRRKTVASTLDLDQKESSEPKNDDHKDHPKPEGYDPSMFAQSSKHRKASGGDGDSMDVTDEGNDDRPSASPSKS